MNEQFAPVGGDVTLCYETFGEPARPAILLIMGLATQMVAWHEDFCAELAERGFFVIRYDNRDIGRSTHVDGVRPPGALELLTRRPRELAYTLEDMADDGIALLDHLDLSAAHVVGASMGGMIAQLLAVRHPARVLSLTSIMSTTGHRWKGQPALRVYPFLVKARPKDRDDAVERIVKLFRVVGSPGFERDENELRAMSALSWDRGGGDQAGGARQLGAIIAAADRTPDLGRITAPTLVIHGTKDKLVGASGGRATAKAIRGSRLLMIDGMGHDMPRGAWPRLIGAIAEHAALAEADQLARIS